MLSAPALAAAAREQTGLVDFGDDGILDNLERLVASLNAEARLTEQGEQMVAGMLVKQAANRLRVEDWLARHPELLEAPVDKPMFVFGLPRTGTTLTINLLAADPDRRCFLRWESLDSVPPPTVEELHAGPRYETEDARLQLSLKYMPHISAIHHEDADSPTEDQFSMSQSFCAQVFESQWRIPAYRDWFWHTDYKPAFRYQKRLLQLLQSRAPGRWTLKNPWHPLFLDDLTGIYPDAQLVMNHRDPVAVVGSACSLIRNVRVMFSDDVDCEEIGVQMMDTFDLMIARMMDYRARHGWESIHDLDYGAMMRDPIGEMRTLYDRFDHPLTAEGEAAMRAMLTAKPKGHMGKHVYALEDYGLTPEKVRARFADYIERFGLGAKD